MSLFYALKGVSENYGNLFVIAKKQRTDPKKDSKRVKSDNFTMSNREKKMNDWMAP